MLKINTKTTEVYYTIKELQKGDVVECNGEYYIVYITPNNKKHLFSLSSLLIVGDATRMHFKKCEASMDITILKK